MTDAHTPLTIRMHPADNVAVVANDGGLPAGTVLPGGLVLREKVPQGHKVALSDIAAGSTVRRYNVPVGYARQPMRRAAGCMSGCWTYPLRVPCRICPWPRCPRPIGRRWRG